MRPKKQVERDQNERKMTQKGAIHAKHPAKQPDRSEAQNRAGGSLNGHHWNLIADHRDHLPGRCAVDGARIGSIRGADYD